MNLKNLKNIITESYINEIGDLKNIIPYNYVKLDTFNYHFESNVGDVDVEVEKIPQSTKIKFVTKSQIFNEQYNGQPLYNISFTVDGLDTQAVKSNLSELNRIVKTVTIIIEKFVQSEKPFGLFVSGANRDSTSLEPDKVKNTLWLSIATGVGANLTGYRIDNGELMYDGYAFKGFMIYQTNPRKIK